MIILIFKRQRNVTALPSQNVRTGITFLVITKILSPEVSRHTRALSHALLVFPVVFLGARQTSQSVCLFMEKVFSRRLYHTINNHIARHTVISESYCLLNNIHTVTNY